jgi:cytochrome c-type biogenesis protein
MDSYFVAIGSAVWLGILTSISPCPLATNIAAMTYIGKQVDRPRYVLVTGLLYTLGRTVTYVVLGVLIVASVLAVPDLSFFLQEYMNKMLGPILLLVGLFLLGVFRINISGPDFSDRLQGRVLKYGIWGAVLLGLLFALSFCPVSAALFFGSLIPLAMEQQSSILMPMLYGIGTALPVVAFAMLIALGTRFIGIVFKKLATFERWARRITGVIFAGIGLYFMIVYLLDLQI